MGQRPKGESMRNWYGMVGTEDAIYSVGENNTIYVKRLPKHTKDTLIMKLIRLLLSHKGVSR